LIALLLIALPGAVLATPSATTVAQSDSASGALTPDALANMTYLSEFAPSNEVTLVDGAFEDPENRYVALLIPQPRAFGQLNGEEAAAVLLGENSGGSGIFTSLAIVLDQDGAPVNVASSLLGDRVDVTSLVITNDQIVVEMVRQGPDDPMCCPTELVRISYALDGNLLVSVDDVVLGSAPQVIVNQAPEGGVQTTVVAPTPYDASASAMPTGAPIHTMVSFVTGDPANPQSDGGPLLVVYPVDDYVQLWQDAGDATIADLVAALQRTLTDQPDALEVSLPIVPPATDVETAAQVSYLTGDGYSGVRFVARATLGGEPTADEQLAYYFSGLTDDGRYLIGAQWPVATTAAGDALNATTDADWTPALSEIDAIVASLTIQSKPGLTVEDLANLTYNSLLLDKPVMLSSGVYTETGESGLASDVTTVRLLDEPIAFGQVGGLEAAAVLLVENGGGTGQFVSLALVQQIGGEAVNSASVFLGDRPRVSNVAINDDSSITVDMIQVGPNDPFCCANMPMAITFVKAGEQLVYRDQASAVIDASTISEGVVAFVVQPTAYDNTVPPSGQGEPKHFSWAFGDVDESMPATLASGGYVAVYPVEAYRLIWDAAGDPFVDDTLTALEALLGEQPANPAPPLPVLPQMSATNDFATQVSYLDLADGGAGVRFIGRFVQDVSPIENYQLRYVFQGLSADGQFLIVANMPVTTTVLPAEALPMNDEEYSQFAAVYDTYLAEMTAALNTLAATDFSPDLAMLDAMLASVAPAVSVNPLAPDSLANMEVKSELTIDGVALLANGLYTEAVAADSASMIEVQLLPSPIAYGVMDGQDAAAVILAESGGGSGVFSNLAVILNQEGTPVHVASAPLGDRVLVQQVAITAQIGGEASNSQITVQMLTQGPDDPICCPSQPVTQVYELQDATLVLVDERTGAAGESTTPLGGTTWTWVETLMNDGSVTAPATEGAFTLTFGADGSVGATTDCNSFTGSFSQGGDVSVSIAFLISTAMACPDEAQEQQFIADVSSVNGFIVTDEGALALLLPFDSGSMIFAPTTADAASAPLGAETDAENDVTESAPTSLPGTTWNWIETQYSNDSVAAPPDPTAYRLTFGTDGTVNVQDDCNVLNGTFTAGDAGELTIDLQTSTMAACPPGSLHDQFILDLAGVASYLFEDGNLFAAIKFDTGVMEFAPAE
jgi:heat shock protein HslJ